jgi:hypothetical protein
MKHLRLIAAAALLAMSYSPASATTGPGCLIVVNVASWDTLNIRASASANARIVARVDPRNQGVLSLRGTCKPKSAPWGQRWCPVAYSDGDGTVRGFVKARFVRDSECP